MKRTFDEATSASTQLSTHETPRARYEDALRHQGRAPLPPRHSSRGHERARTDSAREDSMREEDAGSARLAASRQRAAQHKMRAATLVLVIPTAVFSLMMIATAQVVLRDWRSYESEARIARAQLDALREQLGAGKRRLSSLSSPKGREQILAEHAYIRPGDRMLLFPKEPTPEEGASRTSQHIAARRTSLRAEPSSAWDRAARSMTGWLGRTSASKAAPVEAVADGDAVSPADRIVAPRSEGGR